MSPSNTFVMNGSSGVLLIIMYDRKTDTILTNGGYRFSGEEYWRILMDHAIINNDFEDLLQWVCERRFGSYVAETIVKCTGL